MEIQLWTYVGPSIIKLRPDQFSKLHDLTEREVKVLLQSCDYQIHKINEEITMANGGILIEGDLQKVLQMDEEDSSEHSSYYEDDEGAETKRGMKYSYCFIYPTERKYIARTECRIFHMPESLRAGLLSLDSGVFHNAFHELPKVQYLDKHHKMKVQHTQLKKVKTTLIGIPTQLAHEDPINMFKDKRMALVHKFGRGGDKSIAKSSSNKSRSRRNSIIPRGAMSSSKVLPFGGQSDTDSPDKHQNLKKRTMSVDQEHGNNFNSEEPMVYMHHDHKDNNELSIIESSQSSFRHELEAEKNASKEKDTKNEDNV